MNYDYSIYKCQFLLTASIVNMFSNKALRESNRPPRLTLTMHTVNSGYHTSRNAQWAVSSCDIIICMLLPMSDHPIDYVSFRDLSVQ